MSRFPWIALAIAATPSLAAGQQVFSSVPTQTVYEYQLNYELPWQRWYGGPGLSLGGTMPTQGAIGYSSLNGIPLPGPLGAGVYVNSPAPHGLMMPGPFPIQAPLGMGPIGPMGPMGMPVPGGPPMAGPPARSPASRNRQRVMQAASPAARRTSLEQQNLGDEKLRLQQWTQAYVRYRNSAELAPERPEPHFRLGLCFTALKQYASAIREFKRALDLDPSLPQSGETLSTIFGADNKVMQSQVMPAVADWAREDLRETDRLFLLGLLLHFDDDPRGSEILEAAAKTPGVNDYILAFVRPAVPRIPRLRESRDLRPADPASDLEDESDIPPPPLPSPDPMEIFAPPLEPTPDPPPA